MSIQSISPLLPDPFTQLHPNYLAMPFTKNSHIPASNVLTGTSSATTLSASQCVGPLVFNFVGGTGAYVLPSGPRLAGAFGGGVYTYGTSNGSSNGQVAVGDVFVIDTYLLATSTNPGSITAGTGSSGTVQIPAYTNPSDVGPLIIQFTSVLAGSETYVLQ
jgi:hypothetical protein